MKALNKFIVKLPKKFNDSVKIGDTEIYIETKYNEFNEIVWANSESMPHGFLNYLPTIYYSFK